VCSSCSEIVGSKMRMEWAATSHSFLIHHRWLRYRLESGMTYGSFLRLGKLLQEQCDTLRVLVALLTGLGIAERVELTEQPHLLQLAD